MRYIAQTLLYDKRKFEQPDIETGIVTLVEAGFIYPGQEIELDDERAEILLTIGAIAHPEPDAVVEE